VAPPVLCPRDSPPLLASRNPPSTDPPMPSPTATPSVRRRRPPERGRLPPRPAPVSGAPPPHPPRVGLLPILLLRVILPGLWGFAATTRRAPCCSAGLHVIASARASTSSPHSAASAFSLTVVLPNTGRGAPSPRPPAYTGLARLPPHFNWVLLTQAN
jgi:hypothetical protein